MGAQPVLGKVPGIGKGQVKGEPGQVLASSHSPTFAGYALEIPPGKKPA